VNHGSWTIEIDPRALKALRKLPENVAKDILIFVSKRILSEDNPRLLGKPLSGELKGYWRYRYSDYRIIAEINDKKFRLLIIAVAHRREVYR
jgi:mRNA interferase RelE/StbE